MGKSYCCLQYLCVVVWLVVHLLCQCGQFAAAAGNSSSILCKQHERQALLKIKQILTARNSSVKVGSWVGEDCCQWQGVGCDNVTGNIILLNIINPHPKGCSAYERCPRQDLYEYVDDNTLGSMTRNLLVLKHLTHLELHGPILENARGISFSKVIGGFGTLTQLSYLNLSSFWMVGEIPPEIGKLTNLQVLDLSDNNLEGNVPPQIGNLTNLQVLHLSNNRFSAIRNLTSRRIIYGYIHADVVQLQVDNMRWASSLSNLQFLELSHLDLSQLTVDAWRILSQLPSLSHLGLSGCNLKNNHLSHVFSNDSAIILSTLHYLDLSSNHLKNPLTILGNLSSLSFLDLSNNLLEGSVPGWLKNMRSLQVLILARNGFSHVENGIWGIMGNLCNFVHLDLSENNIHGEILEPQANISSCVSYSLESLDLSINNISGNLPSFLGQLTNLRQLDFSENKLSGEIPDCLGQLTNLKELDFSDNKLSGEIPDCLGQLTEIEHLDISQNYIQGKVSLSHLGSLSKLSYLDMSYNNLSLDIASNWLPPFQLNTFRMTSCKINHSPQWLQTQTRIQDLDLYNTSISGEPHEWFINTTSLLRLNLSNNFLTGPLPKKLSLGGSEDYEESFIDLSSNQFSGPILLNFGKDYCRISSLQLNNNSLTGHIPSSLGNCTELQILDLSRNKLSGIIPPWTSDQLLNLYVLRLQENQLGEVNSKEDSTILKNLCKLTSLNILDLQNNRLSGTIPNCWEYSELQVINLSSNNFSGVIPCSLGNLPKLKYLHLSDNKLGGHIPSCLSSLTYLRLLNLGGNELAGAIPKWFDTSFLSLEVLRLPRNKFRGSVPKELCNLSRLHVMDLSNNQLTGNIPSCFGNLVGMNFPVNTTSDNDLLVSPDSMTDNKINETMAGIAREYSSVLNYLVTIDLSNNDLVGVIPKELTKLFGVIALNLANNSFTGTIPGNIGDMKALETLDLSGNKLYGRIPTSLGHLNFLNHLSLSFNNLSGPIPTSTQLQTLNDPSIYAGNPYLCGDPLPKCLSHDEKPNHSDNQDDEEKTNKLEMMWFYLDVMLGFATGFWGVVGTLLLNKRWRHALFRRVEDASNWLYVGFALKVSKLKKMMIKHYNSNE